MVLYDFRQINNGLVLPQPTFSVSEGTYLVGRSLTCQFAIMDLSVSREHARLSVNREQIDVVDLESRNGTYLNGKQVLNGQVFSNDEIRFGNISFKVESHRAAILPTNVSELETCRLQSDHQQENHLASDLLTPAQQDVLKLLLEGFTEKKIAAQLKVSQHTVHNHVRVIYARLNVHSRAELMSIFISKESPSSESPARSDEKNP